MTAPATEAPAPDSFSSPMDAMEATIAQTLKGSLAEPASDTPAAERTRDENGRFVKAANDVIPPNVPVNAEGQTQPLPGQEGVDGQLAADGDGEPEVVIPEGFAAVPALSDEKVGGRFTVADAEGEIAPPDLTWKFTANGQQIEVSTDKLVAYAQMGKYNHDREQAMQQTQTRMQQVESRAAEFQRVVNEQDQQIERLLSDPEFLLRAQIAYEQQNTPEARMQRDREKLANEQQQWQNVQAHNKSVNYVDNVIAPVLERIASELPTVSRNELAAKFLLAVDPYRKNGILVEDGFMPGKRFIVDELVPWAQQLHDHNLTTNAAPKKEVEQVKLAAKAEIEKQQIRAQKAKNQNARVLRTSGQPGGTGGRQAPDPKSIRNQRDAESAVIGGTLAGMRAG